ncbi:MAG: histidine phosphatase family protein [Clostridia bacterium]|nr:histidine phosphatase family protein [Clostridia bacterium]
MEKTKTRLILVRHCQSMGNLQKVFQGQTDFDISPLGEKQLELLGLRLRNVPVDAIYASPLVRAWKTAEAINVYHKLPIVPMDALKEIDIGNLAGRAPGKVFEGYPELAENWRDHPERCAFPGGESTADVYARAEAVLQKLLSENRGKTVVVVSHGFLMRNMVCVLLDKGLPALSTVRIGGNTSVSEFLISGDGVEVVRLDDSTHLPEELKDRLDFKKI